MRVATYVVLLLLGALLGVWGAFLVPLHVGPLLGSSVVIAVVGNLAVGLLGAAGTGSRLGAALPAAGWLVTVLLLGTSRPEGDLVIPGKLQTDPGVATVGTLFVLLGGIAAALAVGIGPLASRRRFTMPPGVPTEGT